MLIHIHKNHCVSLRHGRRRHHHAMRLAFLPLDERRGVRYYGGCAGGGLRIPVRVFIPVPYSLRHHLSLD